MIVVYSEFQKEFFFSFQNVIEACREMLISLDLGLRLITKMGLDTTTTDHPPPPPTTNF